MLVILCAAPQTAPTEAMRLKRLITSILYVNLMGKIQITVNEISGVFGIDLPSFHKRILHGIDIDGQTQGMTGKCVTAAFFTVIETRCVVGQHRGFVRTSEIVNQADAAKLQN